MLQGNTVADWQDSKTCMIQRTSFLFNNELMSDIRFLVGEGNVVKQTIFAHKFILSIGSCVFNAMFNGSLATQSKEIEIPDVEPGAFLAMIKFLYTDFIQIDKETVIATLYAARKYCISTLATKCVQFLCNNITYSNVISTLAEARLYEVPELNLKCFEIIDRDAREVLSCEEFINSDLNTLCNIISRNSLCINECTLFRAVLQWSKAECKRQSINPESSKNQRAVLGRALKLIRFPLMTALEFSIGVSRSGLLTETETISLFQSIIDGKGCSTGFSSIPRSGTNMWKPATTTATSCNESKPVVRRHRMILLPEVKRMRKTRSSC